MAELKDDELIREYAERGSQAAFARLVERHVNLVYSVALRLVGNTHDAQDVSQAVFVVLARKAARVRNRATLTGWLYETTRLTGAHWLRSRARRQTREQEAFMQSTLNDSGTAEVWRQVGPLLEEAMARLGKDDRALLALRFFDNKTGAQAAALLGIAEWAAHKRTTRALEKLRKFFASRGVRSTPTLIAAAISENSIYAAPGGLAKAAAAAALAEGASAVGSAFTLAQGTLKIMAWSKIKSAAVGALVIALAGLAVHEHQIQVALQERLEQMRTRVAGLEADNEQLSKKQPPAPTAYSVSQPQAAAVAATSPAGTIETTNLYTRLKDKLGKLTREQAESYLQSAGRNASSLLAAYRTSGETALLKEAMQKFPNDPHVAFEAVFDKSLAPEEQRQWLTAFETSAPDNALANYLSALNYFNSGQTNQAVQELEAGSGKAIDNYSVERYGDDADAYLAAGYSLAEAKMEASNQLLLPQLAQLRQLGLDTVALANTYTQAGDAASAQSVLQMVAAMGQQCGTSSPGAPLITQLVGMALEKIALSSMDPNAPFGDSGMTVQDQSNQLTKDRAAAADLCHQAEALFPQMTDEDWIVDNERFMRFGEQNALQWVVNKYGAR